MQTIKRLTEDDIRKIIADHFKVKENKIEFENTWTYVDWICEVEIE
jgi:hypothetical protein